MAMAEEKQNKENTSVFDPINSLTKWHPQFLRAFKESSPFVVVGSLCIAVSAFTQQAFPQAQAYSLAAATLFLIAFVTSLLFRFFNSEKFSPLDSMLAVSTYVSTAIAILMLFIAVSVFGQSIPTVSDTVSAIPHIITALFCGMLSYLMYKKRYALYTKLNSKWFNYGTQLAVGALFFFMVTGLFFGINAYFKLISDEMQTILVRIVSGVSILLTSLYILPLIVRLEKFNKSKPKV
ncbi:MAG: hypothetical protein NWF01_05820 [Candidatus Bathyarchaeota archaeon]|nr:hypothetical protein [Candidatus Bathyarchaeota archaeon]